MTRVGISSLFALIQAIDRTPGWFRTIPGLGKRGADGIQQWLASMPSLQTQAQRAASNVILRATSNPVPAWPTRSMRDWFPVQPLTLTGAQGQNRAPKQHSLLNADDDFAALNAWLMRWEFQTPPGDEQLRVDLQQASVLRQPPIRNLTARAYRKEIERLLLWCVSIHGKAFSSLKTEDAYAYRDFLLSPPCAWQGKRHRREGELWRPFVKPLAEKSVAYALCIINAWCNYLVSKCYINGNPFAGVTMPTEQGRRAVTSKRWTPDEWHWIARALDHLDSTEALSESSRLRLRLVMALGYSTGLRPQELVDATLGDLTQDGGRWSIKVLGKGRKHRTVPLPSTILEPLLQYLIVARRISSDPATWPREAPLFAALTPDHKNEAITTRSLLAHIKRLLKSAEKIAPKNVAARIANGSTHWLRNTYASTMLENQTPAPVLLDLMGHASLSTQRIYTDTDARLRANEVERVFAGPLRP
jgi:site-specific recombinase XerD